MTDLVQITIWSPPGDWIDTQWGFITIREWLNNECARINIDSDRKAEVKPHKYKLDIALFVDNRTQRRIR